ncbi:RCC1 domain-containing protein [Pseudenhygromyxa sp. WMMC2535]|uniref:RCC1 domain-containing protein n=1 Tax=Pseudenhygromyxa sp. WMMC2535 TaxID=2712867 RepID=UPI0031F74867
MSGLADVVALAAAPDHTCALVGDGNVWCWGGNLRGGLVHPDPWRATGLGGRC